MVIPLPEFEPEPEDALPLLVLPELLLEEVAGVDDELPPPLPPPHAASSVVIKPITIQVRTARRGML
ncbi:MAG: hypothetical protein JWM78_3188 [Verrucomicrobiaceae bacterium]|nr:hypothetical protein [Verrucomicrobiaceae bacterium]